MDIKKPSVPDNTSGTADFDDFEDREPDDCYCESTAPLSEFDQYFQEYTSSKQRNRQKKFLKEKHFVPNKNNPKTGMIDSTEIDQKTGKPIRVQFSYDNEKSNNHEANASSDSNMIHMNERLLKKHPDISNAIFAHEDGHLIYNRNPAKYVAEAEKVGKAIETSGLIPQMNEHGAKIDEYFADKNSMDKVGYNATVRMLRSLIDPTRFEKTKKAIRKDPYCFVLSGFTRQTGQDILKKFGKDGMTLVGFFSAEGLYKFIIESNERMIKNKISLKRELLKDVTDKDKKDAINNYIIKGIDGCKKNIAEAKEKLAEIKESRRKIREKLSKELHNMQPDKEKLIQYLIEGTDKNEKENIVEINFRIKMLDFWKDIDKNKPVTEGCDYMPLSEFDHYFQEAKMKAKTRKELDDSDFALVYKDASGEKIRKYPINDEAHVKAAARMFPRGVPNKYRKEVAGKILRRAHKFGIDTSGWKSLNAANEKD